MRNLSVLCIVFVSLVLVVGCGSAPATQVQKDPTAPDWVDELAPEDAFWGIGLAKLQNESLAAETATTRAQRDVGRQISTLVQGLLTDYAKESGLANNSRSIQSIENIGRNLVNVNLSGATPNARKRMPDGTWWVRVAVKKADAQKAVNSIVNNEMADFAEFKAAEALKMLDYELGKAQSKPSPVSAD